MSDRMITVPVPDLLGHPATAAQMRGVFIHAGLGLDDATPLGEWLAAVCDAIEKTEDRSGPYEWQDFIADVFGGHPMTAQLTSAPVAPDPWPELAAMSDVECRSALAYLAGYDPGLFVRVMEVTRLEREGARARRAERMAR